MLLSKSSTLTLLAFTLLACNQAPNQSDYAKKIDSSKKENITPTLSTLQKDTIVNNVDEEDKVVDTVFTLTEVKERAKYIEQQTKGKRHLKVWVESSPQLADQKYYWIKVGEDNGTNLVTHFNFYVYPDSMRIMYYDAEKNKEIALSEWRKIKDIQ